MHAAHSQPLPEYDAWRVDLGHPVMRGARSRAEVMVQAAALICATGVGYQHMGRGPDLFDEIGLVRACVQAAVDWAAAAAGAHEGILAQPQPISDLAGYGAEQARYDPTPFEGLVLAWGLRLVATAADTNLQKAAQPGDVFLCTGRGPALGVVVSPWRETAAYPHYEAPAVAAVHTPNPPRIVRRSVMNHMPVALYRFADEAVALVPTPAKAAGLRALMEA